MDITMIVMAIPGNSDNHQTASNTSWPSDTIMPQAGAPGGTPTPRKLSEASSRMVWPTSRLRMINTVLTTFGKMCRHIIMVGDTPATTARVT